MFPGSLSAPPILEDEWEPWKQVCLTTQPKKTHETLKNGCHPASLVSIQITINGDIFNTIQSRIMERGVHDFVVVLFFYYLLLAFLYFNSENFLRLQIFYEDLSVAKTINEEAYKVTNSCNV